MSTRRQINIDGNEAVASVAYRTNEVIAIYPITPASPMGELADAWSAQGRPNIWGGVPDVVEMQSEGGAAGAVHGALQAGSLTTTFTASQGLLLKIPNLYKIAGELTAFSMHVAARTIATHALSIFADHSDVMAARQTGCALLASGSVQEAHDFALVAQAATLSSRIPFIHFFDGFRTSHEVNKIEELADEDLAAMLDDELIFAHRERALTPDRPVIRGTAQNPDAFFQAREACNGFYAACPGLLQETMDRFAKLTGRAYKLFDYHGDPEAERVAILMGSGAETTHETVDWLLGKGEKVGVLRVRLFRPFSVESFVQALPPTVRSLAVLDRTKEPGAVGDPLYMDVVTALREARDLGLSPWTEEPRLIAGRYGLSSKEFDPACVKAVYDELAKDKPLLRPRLRRHRERQQELDQDHRRGDRSLRPGVLRLRLQESGRGDHLASAVWRGNDPLHLPRPAGRLCRLSPVPVSRSLRDPRLRRARGDLSAQRPLWSGRGLGPPAAGDSGGDRRQEAPALGDRRLQGGARDRDGWPHQHHHADLFLRTG
jgi:pyruvate-ferredoxin/flavodoxin oxidoreductase